MPAVQKEELVQAAIQKDLDNYFDLTKDILFRISVIKLNNNDWRLIISNHHIIIDGWCTGMIVNELFHYYSLLKNNETIHLKKHVHLVNISPGFIVKISRNLLNIGDLI